ncbi:hypothetical protein B0H19DRAFT_1066682 [Mycena capillaripes]|nr:hypothetical protein B0H19DRAFT_1066682 [Mycena capillaripes]
MFGLKRHSLQIPPRFCNVEGFFIWVGPTPDAEAEAGWQIFSQCRDIAECWILESTVPVLVPECRDAHYSDSKSDSEMIAAKQARRGRQNMNPMVWELSSRVRRCRLRMSRQGFYGVREARGREKGGRDREQNGVATPTGFANTIILRDYFVVSRLILWSARKPHTKYIAPANKNDLQPAVKK